MKEKTCVICGLPKPLEEFYDNPSAKDRKGNKCKVCANAYDAECKQNQRLPGNPKYHKFKYTIQDSFLLNSY